MRAISQYSCLTLDFVTLDFAWAEKTYSATADMATRKEGGMRTTMRPKSLFSVLLTFLLAAWSVPDAHAVDYKLAMSEEKDVCELVLTLSNEKFSNKGLSSFMQLENLPELKAPEFELVEWEEVSVNSSLSTAPTSSTVVDINNDGQLDWVVKTQWSIGGQYNERLDIYSNHRVPLSFEGSLDIKDLDRADQHLAPKQGMYILKKLPPHTWNDGKRAEYWIGGVFKLIPFRFRNVTYILLATPGGSQELPLRMRMFTVVAKYVPSFDLQDVCYLEEVRNKTKNR